MSGYGLTKEVRRVTGYPYTPGAIYPLLYELERKRLINKVGAAVVVAGREGGE